MGKKKGSCIFPIGRGPENKEGDTDRDQNLSLRSAGSFDCRNESNRPDVGRIHLSWRPASHYA
jgi:hypothetical protein